MYPTRQKLRLMDRTWSKIDSFNELPRNGGLVNRRRGQIGFEKISGGGLALTTKLLIEIQWGCKRFAGDYKKETEFRIMSPKQQHAIMTLSKRSFSARWNNWMVFGENGIGVGKICRRGNLIKNVAHRDKELSRLADGDKQNHKSVAVRCI